MRNRLALAVLSAALLSATASLAQAPTSQAPTSQAQPPAGAPAPVPEAMPNDIPYGAPVGVEMAEKAITAAAAEARKHNWKMSISVVDPSGNLIAHHTMDGTQYASIAISQAKARTAALYRRPSKALADGINGGSPGTLSLLALSAGAASEGGFPIVVNGKLIGAIGASGGFASQDGVTAKAGLTALGSN
jgi:glc operon protein GlcG